MKTCLTFKQLLITLCLAPSIGFSAPLCSSVLNAPKQQGTFDVEEALQSIARMALTLDLEKSHGGQRSVNILMRQEFREKTKELTEALNLTNQELQQLISKRVRVLQGLDKLDHLEMENIKKSQAQLLKVRTSNQYFLRESIPLPDMNLSLLFSENYIISPNGLYLIGGHHIIPLTVKGGEIRDLQNKRKIWSLPNNSFVPTDGYKSWSLLNNDTLVMKPLNLDLSEFGQRIRVAKGEAHLLIHDSDSRTSNRYIYLDENGQVVKEGFFPQEFGKELEVTIVGEDQWLVGSTDDHTTIHLYSPTKGTSAPITVSTFPNSRPVIQPISGTSEVAFLIEPGGNNRGEIKITDLLTLHSRFRKIDHPRGLVAVNSEHLLITGFGLTMLNRRTLEKVELPPNFSRQQSQLLLGENVPESSVISINFRGDYTKNSAGKLNGIFSAENLQSEFNFENRYEKSDLNIVNQWISPDGRRIVNHVRSADGKHSLEVWDL